MTEMASVFGNADITLTRDLRDAISRVPRLGNQAIYIMGGQTEYQVDSSVSPTLPTFEAVMEVPAFGAKSISNIIPILAASRSASNPNYAQFFVDLKPVESFATLDAGGSWGGTTMSTFLSLQTTIRVPLAAAANRRKYQMMDPISPTMPDRDDGGTVPLLAARMWWGTSSQSAWMGKSVGGDIDLTPWLTRSVGKARFRRNTVSGDQRSSQANWASFNTSPLIGYIYNHDTPVCNIMVNGDSTADSARAIGVSAAFANVCRVSCEALNTAQSDLLFVPSNMAWSGVPSATFLQNFEDALLWGLVPDIAMYTVGSPNDGDPLTEAIYRGWKRNLAKFLTLCRKYNVTPILLTMLPCNTAVHNWGATDSYRQLINSDVLALPDRNIVVADQAAAVSGATVNGQVQYAVGMTSDDIHLNDLGIATVSTVAVQPAIKKALRGIY
jgi:hypothetical protein